MTLSGAVVDLDGTIYRGGDLLPGAGAALEALRRRDVSTLFFSNNPTKTGAGYLDRLDRLGLDVDGADALSAADVTVTYLREAHPDRPVALVGSDALRAILRESGIDVVEDYAGADVLLASWTPDFGYDDMAAVANDLPAEATFLGTDPDRRVPTADGGVMPGSGSVINAIAGVLERQPDRVLGKPSGVARRAALDRLGAPPAETVVIGDNLGTDVALGAAAGMRTVLVLSGHADERVLESSAVDPDHVVGSLEELDGLLAEVEES